MLLLLPWIHATQWHTHTLNSEAGGRSDCRDIVGGGAGVGPAVLYSNG